MSRLYTVKKEYEPEWQQRLSPEEYRKLKETPFDIDKVVDLAKEWDCALQRMLNQLEVVSDDA